MHADSDESTRARFHPFHAAIQSRSNTSQLRYTSFRESYVVTILNGALLNPFTYLKTCSSN